MKPRKIVIFRLFSVSKAQCLCCCFAKFITFSQLEKRYNNRPSTSYSRTLLLLLYFAAMRAKYQPCCAGCSKNGTHSVRANVPPGRGTNGLKNGTSRQKQDGWQPYSKLTQRSSSTSLSTSYCTEYRSTSAPFMAVTVDS